MEQTQKEKTAKPYSPEFRERAVQMANLRVPGTFLLDEGSRGDFSAVFA